ncbi:MAG TPA: hypothetical protein VGQ33_08745, partial [Vicinamibacteria bacterium]|nr:hypothetical protein [Vicinamibacteria bacterium]
RGRGLRSDEFAADRREVAAEGRCRVRTGKGCCESLSAARRLTSSPAVLMAAELAATSCLANRIDANIALRCRRHNQYEAELVFGPRRIPMDRPVSDPIPTTPSPGPSWPLGLFETRA